MRQVWKGLIVGGLTGAAAGIVLDLGSASGRQLSRAGRRVGELAPRAADRVGGALAAGADRIDPGAVAEQVHRAAKRVADSDPAERAIGAVGEAVGHTRP